MFGIPPVHKRTLYALIYESFSQVSKVKELSDDHAKMGVALDRARLAVQQRERAADDVLKQVCEYVNDPAQTPVGF